MKKRFRASTQAELREMIRQEIGTHVYQGMQQLKNAVPSSGTFLQARMPYDVYIK